MRGLMREHFSVRKPYICDHAIELACVLVQLIHLHGLQFIQESIYIKLLFFSHVQTHLAHFL